MRCVQLLPLFFVLSVRKLFLCPILFYIKNSNDMCIDALNVTWVILHDIGCHERNELLEADVTRIWSIQHHKRMDGSSRYYCSVVFLVITMSAGGVALALSLKRMFCLHSSITRTLMQVLNLLQMRRQPIRLDRCISLTNRANTHKRHSL